MTSRTGEEARFRAIYRHVHEGHPRCLDDEWLGGSCPADVVWSRRNGPWHRVPVLFVGAAPGNAGGMGGGEMGAHGTRIPFGGDIAGANLDLLLGSIGLDRNHTFIVASLNTLPEAGGGEPRVRELRAPVGAYPSSVHLLRDTLLAAGPRLVVALGNVALRTTIGAAALDPAAVSGPVRLPGLARLRSVFERGRHRQWPDAFPPGPSFRDAWNDAWDDPLPHILWLLHPSAQNMSPYAGTDTVFHRRMLETREALRRAGEDLLGEAPATRPLLSVDGIYALREWRELVGPRHGELEALWREKGL